MAEHRTAFVPETDEEAQLLAALGKISKDAYFAGVDQEVVVSALAVTASNLSMKDLPDDPDDFDLELDQPGDPAEGSGKREDCPECEAEIDDVIVSMGGDVMVLPCHCEVSVEDVPGWVETPGGDDGSA